MKFKIKNLIFNFTYDSDQEEWMGMASMTIKAHHLRDVIDDLHDEHCDWERIMAQEVEEDSDKNLEEIDLALIAKSLGDWEPDVIEEWLIAGANEDYETRNSDLQIVIFSILYDADEDIEIDYCGENPYWVFHDICHSQRDVQYAEIYVDQYIEEDRIFDGFELIHEHNMLSHVNGDLLAQIKKGFKERWDHDFNLNKAVEYLNNN